MVDQFLRYLTYEKRYSPHTLVAYEDDLDQLFDFIKETFEISEPKEIRHMHLRSWVVSMIDAGISPRSVNRRIACLKSYFKFLQVREYLTKNPASRLKPLKTDKKLPTFVREGEMIKLLDQVEFSDDFEGKRDKLLIELFYSTGIRLAELISLREKDINFYDSSIKVLGKRNKERVIPIPDSIVKYVKEFLSLKKDMWVAKSDDILFTTDKGRPLYPMLVYRVIKKYLGAVTTLSKKSPHVLRHTFATHLLDKGADLNAVKDLLGHTSLAATQVYTHNSLEKLKSAFDQAHPKA